MKQAEMVRRSERIGSHQVAIRTNERKINDISSGFTKSVVVNTADGKSVEVSGVLADTIKGFVTASLANEIRENKNSIDLLEGNYMAMISRFIGR